MAAAGQHISSLDPVCGTFFIMCMAAILKYWNYCSLWMNNIFTDSLHKHFLSQHKFHKKTGCVGFKQCPFWFYSDEKVESLTWFATFESKIKKSGAWLELWQHRFTFSLSLASLPQSSSGICHLIIHEYLNSYEMTFTPVGIHCRRAAIFYIKKEERVKKKYLQSLVCYVEWMTMHSLWMGSKTLWWWGGY